MQFWEKSMYNIQQPRVSSNWPESKTKKSVMELLRLSSQPENWCLQQNHSWKWTFILLLSSLAIIKLWISPKKLLQTTLNQSILQMMKKYSVLYKIVSEPNLPADGENLSQTLPLKPLKSSWDKEPRRNLILKSKDTPKSKKFQVELLKNQKSLKELW